MPTFIELQHPTYGKVLVNLCQVNMFATAEGAVANKKGIGFKDGVRVSFCGSNPNSYDDDLVFDTSIEKIEQMLKRNVED